MRSARIGEEKSSAGHRPLRGEEIVTLAQWSYLAMIGFVILGSGWLEIVFHTRVYRRWRRWIRVLIPVVILFGLWDAYAISAGHWNFDSTQTIGVIGPFGIPLEEFLFFIFVPLAAILTLEAVRRVKPTWSVGDER
jgi:lycopene cyclase domain-containing protein